VQDCQPKLRKRKKDVEKASGRKKSSQLWTLLAAKHEKKRGAHEVAAVESVLTKHGKKEKRRKMETSVQDILPRRKKEKVKKENFSQRSEYKQGGCWKKREWRTWKTWNRSRKQSILYMSFNFVETEGAKGEKRDRLHQLRLIFRLEALWGGKKKLREGVASFPKDPDQISTCQHPCYEGRIHESHTE